MAPTFSLSQPVVHGRLGSSQVEANFDRPTFKHASPKLSAMQTSLHIILLMEVRKIDDHFPD